MPPLYILKNLTTQDSIEIDQPSITLGRDETCDITINSEESSRQHACLEVKDNGLQVRDLGSTNGTYLNNRKIRASAVVTSGDTLTIASESYLIITSESGANRTIFGARVEDDSSYILEKDDPDATSIRMRYPSPPGWSDADVAGLSWTESSKEDREMTRRLQLAGADESNVAAALLAIGTEGNGALYLVPRTGEEGTWSIGRSKERDITIDHLTVSSLHAMLILSAEGWSINDHDSTNGIKINNKRRIKGKIADGDRIKIGQVELYFRGVYTAPDIK